MVKRPHITGWENSDIPAPLRAEAEAVAIATVKACVRIARRKANELPLPAAWFPNVKISWSTGRSRSRGGKGASPVYAGGGISMALTRHVAGGHDRAFTEYSHIADSPVIGNLPKTRWQTVVAAVTCHEVAHAIQFVVRGRSARCRKVDFKTAHGRGWQQVYAMLRREIVNPLLLKPVSDPMPVLAAIEPVTPMSMPLPRAGKLKAFSKLLGFAVDVRLKKDVAHLVADVPFVRLAPRKLRRHHETLCDGTIAWTLDELPIAGDVLEAVQCLHCHAIAGEFLAAQTKAA